MLAPSEFGIPASGTPLSFFKLSSVDADVGLDNSLVVDEVDVAKVDVDEERGEAGSPDVGVVTGDAYCIDDELS